jgi:hypothetical protein
MRKFLPFGVAALVLPALVNAQTAAIDVSDAVDQLDTIGTTVLAVGGALLVAAAIAVAVKWAKASIFG